MHSVELAPRQDRVEAGAVGALENIKTPSEVAKLILKYTNHIFLVGEGAKRFALSFGFKEEDLLTDHSREAWLRWRAPQAGTTPTKIKIRSTIAASQKSRSGAITMMPTKMRNQPRPRRHNPNRHRPSQRR